MVPQFRKFLSLVEHVHCSSWNLGQLGIDHARRSGCRGLCIKSDVEQVSLRRHPTWLNYRNTLYERLKIFFLVDHDCVITRRKPTKNKVPILVTGCEAITSCHALKANRDSMFCLLTV